MLSMPFHSMHQEFIVFRGRRCQPWSNRWTSGGCIVDRESGSVLVVEEEEGGSTPRCHNGPSDGSQKRDLARLEELATRARKAESVGFHLSRSSSPQPPSSARSGSKPSDRASLPAPPASARRSSLPPAPVNAEYYDESGANVRVYRGNGTINLDPNHPDNGSAGDPFADRQSVSTTNTQSTNIIPFQYIPPSRSDDTPGRAQASPGPGGSVSQAARTLDEARQNLFRPRQTPPQRPARSPDLHLRLSPPRDGDSQPDPRSPKSQPPDHMRDSYLSGNSSTPSFLSGNSYDIHTDAPRIVTSKQVQIGRLHQAEVVQLGQNQQLGGQGRLLPVHGNQAQQYNANGQLLPPAGISPLSPGPTGGSLRTLTPTSRNFQQEDAEEGLISEEPSATTPTDLRFSMGSLAYDRNSVSTVGTANFLARPNSSAPRFQPPSPAATAAFAGPRESMFSTKSYADSFLGGFPMIPPSQNGQMPHLPASTLPVSTSVSTLDQATIPRPPPTYKPLTSVRPGKSSTVIAGGPGTGPSRPTTAISVTESFLETTHDSFLGTFPFVPPNIDDLAELPIADIPDTAVSKGNGLRNMAGMSTTSEGLGGFDFAIEGAPPLPGREGKGGGGGTR